MAGSYANSSEYIKHHLTNLVYGQHPDGSWGIAHGADEIKEMGFWSINVDSMMFSVGLGFLKGGKDRIGETVRAYSPVRDQDVMVEVCSAHHIDPKGERQRG